MTTISEDRKWWATGILFGLLLGGIFSVWQLVVRTSDYSQYRQIQIGMTREQTIVMLRQTRIPCGNDMLVGSSNSCSFADPWREYKISFDSQTNRVDKKSFGFRREPPL